MVRVAEAAALELVDGDVKSGLGRIAIKRGLIGCDLVGRVSPLELVGRHVSDGRRIEFDGTAGSDKAQRCRNRKRQVRQSVTIGHVSLPLPMLAHGAYGASAGLDRKPH